jgi:hypothetical protein
VEIEGCAEFVLGSGMLCDADGDGSHRSHECCLLYLILSLLRHHYRGIHKDNSQQRLTLLELILIQTVVCTYGVDSTPEPCMTKAIKSKDPTVLRTQISNTNDTVTLTYELRDQIRFESPYEFNHMCS